EGMTCTLYAMKRIAFFNPADTNAQAYQSYKQLKKLLAQYDHDYQKMIAVANDIIDKHNIDLEKALLSDDNFMTLLTRYRANNTIPISVINFYNKLDPRVKWTKLYDILIEKIIAPLMNLKNAGWHPRDGFTALKASLEKNGAHWFMGKFGAWCYSKKPKQSKESTD